MTSSQRSGPPEADVADLERDIHQVLRALPEPRAPRSLAPRVMAAIAANAAAQLQPQPGWRQWPLAWQMLSLVAAASVVLAIVVFVPLASAWIGGLETTRVAAALWRTLVAPLATPLIVLMGVMCTFSALLVAGLKHVAWEGQRTLHS